MADTDSDGDGTADDKDAFPDDPNEVADTDADGLPDSFEPSYSGNPTDPGDALIATGYLVSGVGGGASGR